MKLKIVTNVAVTLFVLVLAAGAAYAQKPMRAGTTAANFLEIGYGAAGAAMGDSYVSVANDVSSSYWNPAGLARMEQNEAMFMYQPWLVDTKSTFAAVGLVLPDVGTVGLSLISLSYGDIPVTTLAMQEGTGETYTASDMAFSLSYARKLVTWFSAGVSAKYVTSTIWHETASAVAFDLGVIISTRFFSPTAEGDHGLNIGMSISNYGTQMKYDGMDLLNPIDISASESGNFRDAPGQFKLQEWELPLIFRLGASVNPVYTDEHQVTISVDALHPNNNSESVNVGAQYAFVLPSFGKVFFRGGYKALFMEDAEYGLSLGFGVTTQLLGNNSLKAEYAYRDIGILGKAHCLGVGVLF